MVKCDVSAIKICGLYGINSLRMLIHLYLATVALAVATVAWSAGSYALGTLLLPKNFRRPNIGSPSHRIIEQHLPIFTKHLHNVVIAAGHSSGANTCVNITNL
jgi:hypothetical protein